MEIKKKYQTPDTEITIFLAEDVITSSVVGNVEEPYTPGKDEGEFI